MNRFLALSVVLAACALPLEGGGASRRRDALDAGDHEDLELSPPVVGVTAGTGVIGIGRAGTETLAAVSPGGVGPTLCGRVDLQGHFVPLQPLATTYNFAVGPTGPLRVAINAVEFYDTACVSLGTRGINDAGNALVTPLRFDDGWLLRRQIFSASDVAFLSDDGGLTPWVEKWPTSYMALGRDGPMAILVGHTNTPAPTLSLDWFDPHTTLTAGTSSITRSDPNYLGQVGVLVTASSTLFTSGVSTGIEGFRYAPNAGAPIDSMNIALGRPQGLVEYAGEPWIIQSDDRVRRLSAGGLQPPVTGLSTLDAGPHTPPILIQTDGGDFVIIPSPLRVAGLGAGMTPTTPLSPFYARVDDQLSPQAAVRDDGSVVAWWVSDRDSRHVVFQLFDPNGLAVGASVVIDRNYSGNVGADLFSFRSGLVALTQEPSETFVISVTSGGLTIGPARPVPFRGFTFIEAASGDTVGWVVGTYSDFTNFYVWGQSYLANGDAGVEWVGPVSGSGRRLVQHVGNDVHVIGTEETNYVNTDAGLMPQYRVRMFRSVAGSMPQAMLDLRDRRWIGATPTRNRLLAPDGFIESYALDGGLIDSVLTGLTQVPSKVISFGEVLAWSVPLADGGVAAQRLLPDGTLDLHVLQHGTEAILFADGGDWSFVNTLVSYDGVGVSQRSVFHRRDGVVIPVPDAGPSSDAGVDAGADAGIDAGIDAGTDGGAELDSDAGSLPDAGQRGPGVYGVGCGCSEWDGSGTPLLLLAAWLVSRVRSVTRSS